MLLDRCSLCRRVLDVISATGHCSSCVGSDPELTTGGGAVLACPAMTTPVAEIEAWLEHHNLGLSVEFSDRVYNVDLRRPIGDGSSVSIMESKAAEFAVALVSACESYERIDAQRTS